MFYITRNDAHGQLNEAKVLEKRLRKVRKHLLKLTADIELTENAHNLVEISPWPSYSTGADIMLRNALRDWIIATRRAVDEADGGQATPYVFPFEPTPLQLLQEDLKCAEWEAEEAAKKLAEEEQVDASVRIPF